MFLLGGHSTEFVVLERVYVELEDDLDLCGDFDPRNDFDSWF